MLLPPRLLSFGARTEASVPLMLALTIIPAIGIIGAAVDYSRASYARSVMQTAADAAAIAYARSSSHAPGQKKQEAKAVFDATVSRLGGTVSGLDLKIREKDGVITAQADARLGNSFTPDFLLRAPDLGVKAEVIMGAQGKIEVAIVLDNTSSMAGDMVALKEAARELVDTILPAGRTPTATSPKVSVVPYVAAVNPGRSVLQDRFMDLNAESPWHAYFLRWAPVAAVHPCIPGGGTGMPPGSFNPGTGGSGFNLLFERANRYADILGRMLGPAAARADEATWPVVTPNTRPPFVWQAPVTTPTGITVRAPAGFLILSNCLLQSPARISHFDLFRRIPGARWKGCVEARPVPFDVTDEPPNSANPNTLFVPYFYPDGADPRPPGSFYASWIFKNNYMPDGSTPKPDWPDDDSPNERTRTILKYDGLTPASIDETPPSTRGPNAACPDEVLRLTDSRADVLNKIDGLSYWEGGGTIVSEGLMWGWRSLSPRAPFSDGRPYGEARKVIVLMTDGKNEINANFVHPDSSMIGEYTAYGHVGNAGRVTMEARADGAWSFPDASRYLDERLALACTNAKAAGVEIFTVLFRETDPKIVAAMRDCASSPAKAFTAANGGALVKAFKDVGRQIGELRLTR